MQHLSDDDDLDTDGLSPDERLGQSFSDACDNRCIFVTNAGRIGLGPKGSSEGDEVCILYGGNTPYVVRSQQQETGQPHYAFIGECYVHGIMKESRPR